VEGLKVTENETAFMGKKNWATIDRKRKKKKKKNKKAGGGGVQSPLKNGGEAERIKGTEGQGKVPEGVKEKITGLSLGAIDMAKCKTSTNLPQKKKKGVKSE